MAFDFSDPYPAILRMRAPRGSPIWWDANRNFSPTKHPDLRPMIASSTLVLQALPSGDKDDATRESLWAI